MKNILKIITLVVTVLFVTASCAYDDSNYDALTKGVEANSTYYVQFANASKTLATSVSLSGALVEIETTVDITLMGAPQSKDIVVKLTLDPSSTIAPSMYVLSANSITIPAGKTSGSVTLKTIAANMPVGQTLKFALKLDAGEHNSPNPIGTKLLYNLKRIEFCPLVNGSADLAGSYTVTTDVNAGNANGAGENNFTAVQNGTKLNVSGLAVFMMNNFWGEDVVSGGTFTMDIAGNGFVTIPRQYIYTTNYKGALSRYEIIGSGTWTNCGTKPTLTLKYDIYYEGDARGLALDYKSYFNVPYMGGTWTKN